jgi:hypothetical protein
MMERRRPVLDDAMGVVVEHHRNGDGFCDRLEVIENAVVGKRKIGVQDGEDAAAFEALELPRL